MPFHPPSITAEESVDELREASVPAGAADRDATAPGSARRPAEKRASRMRRFFWSKRIWLAVVLGILVVAAAAAAVMISVSARPADVVPYPTVTGTLGDHLKELQKSVAP